MADNRVVIKINYDKEKHRKALIDPKMVTVWHTKRISVAVAILLVLVTLVFFWFFAEDVGEHNSQSAQTLNNPTNAIEQTPATITPPKILPPVEQDVADIKSTTAKRPTAIIFDKRVIRASLNAVLKNDEPVDPIKLPVIIEPNQTVELFYFSEIKDMKNHVLFHHWFKDGKVNYKKKLDIKTNKSRLISSKKLTAKDSGDWQVVLVDKKGELFSEVNFSVNTK